MVENITEVMVIAGLYHAKAVISGVQPQRDISEIPDDEVLTGLIVKQKPLSRGPKGLYFIEYNLGNGPKLIVAPYWPGEEILAIKTRIKFTTKWSYVKGQWIKEGVDVYSA